MNDKDFLEIMTLDKVAEGFCKYPGYLRHLKVKPAVLLRKLTELNFDVNTIVPDNIEEMDALIRYINIKNKAL